ncbi:tetratricopeptide repeat protein [Halobacteriovorax sp.]|uniref:tetratricopeptide repeat protein n=1 Tax=Halobacteriovorax sp. TaxID=2020862 RepID=UPI00356551AF
MKILLLLPLLIVVSCSTGSKKEVAGPSSGSIEEFSWVENTDFNEVPEVAFNSRDDSFQGDVAEIDSLSTESLARIPEPKLEKVDQSADILVQGITHCYRRNFEEGKKIFQDNLRKYKSHPGYWNMLGTCYYLQGKMRSALLYYNKSRGLKKDYAPPVNNLGVIYQYNGLEQKALSAYKRASEVGSFSMTPMFNMGQLYLKYHLTSDAKNIFSRLVKKNATDVDALNGLATSYLMEGNAEAAVSLFSRLTSVHYSKPQIGINFSLALADVGRRKDAQTILSSINTAQLGEYAPYYSKVLTKLSGASK